MAWATLGGIATNLLTSYFLKDSNTLLKTSENIYDKHIRPTYYTDILNNAKESFNTIKNVFSDVYQSTLSAKNTYNLFKPLSKQKSEKILPRKPIKLIKRVNNKKYKLPGFVKQKNINYKPYKKKIQLLLKKPNKFY